MEGREGNTFGDCESGRPLIAENIKTDTSVGVDVWMIDSCREVDLKKPSVSMNLDISGREGNYLWGFEGVVCWEMDGEEENSSGIRTIALKHTS